jgi:hypothetical protein
MRDYVMMLAEEHKQYPKGHFFSSMLREKVLETVTHHQS